MWAMKHVTDVQVRPTPMWPTGTTVIEPTVDPSRVSESCLFKPVLSAVMGGGLGVLAGVLLGSYESITPPIEIPGQPAPPPRGFRREAALTAKRTAVKARQWGRNFALVTAVFSGVECAVEKTRGTKDMFNPVVAGCATGAALAAKAGPQAAGVGCAGFAAFSVLFEYIMH